jgi:hypothetical protein
MARFGCLMKIFIDNAQAFKSIEMINLCQKYNIILGHSTTYYHQGNGLVESSNKIFMNIIKKFFTKKKKSWKIHLKCALWANRIGTKKYIGMSPFQLVYGTDVYSSY